MKNKKRIEKGMKIFLLLVFSLLLTSLAQAQYTSQTASTTTMQPASQQLSFSSLNLQQPFMQQNTFQQDPLYFYPYYAQDPALQYGFSPEMCNKTGMDFIVEIMPDACQPAPVRSDLLEEQSVPVFCRLTGVKINPLIQVPYIERIDAKTELRSPGIMSVTYHPPGSALSFMSYQPPSQENQLEGVPMMSNLGYLVIYLQQQPVEAQMPESVKVEETLKLTYRVARTFGISQNSFALRKMSNEEWQANYKQYSFWQGKGYLRLDDIQNNKARVSVYRDSNTVIGSATLGEGQRSENEIKLPGFYCGAGVLLQVDEIDVPKIRARMLVNGEEVLLREGQDILDSGCKVTEIYSSTTSFTGNVEIFCDGKKEYLELRNLEAKLRVGTTEDTYTVGGEIKKDDQYYYVGYVGKEYTESNNRLESYVIVFEKTDGKEMELGEKERVISALNDLVIKIHREGKQVHDYGGAKIAQKLQDDYKINYVGLNLWIIKHGVAEQGISLLSTTGLLETTYHGGIEGLFHEAIEAYENVDYSYPLVPSPEGTIYGVQSLMAAAELAGHFMKQETQAYYLSKLIEKYDSEEGVAGTVDEARKQLAQVLTSDYSQATRTISSKGSDYRITLLSIEKPSLATQFILADVNGESGYYGLHDTIADWRVHAIEEGVITLTCNIQNCGTETNKIEFGKPRELSVGGRLYSPDLTIEIKQINSVKEVQVTVLPFEERRTTETNFTVEIGIEKRAIQLNPEKTSEKIQSLNRIISTIGNVKNTLGRVVETWKKACLVGGAVLWAKNFIQGLDGTAFARREVMDYWSAWCGDKDNQQLVGAQTIAGCYNAKSNEINNDVDRTKEAIQLSNRFIEQVKSKDGVVKKSGLFGLSKSIDQEKFFAEAQLLLKTDDYKHLLEQDIVVNEENIQGTISANDLGKFDLNVLKERGFLGTENVKEIIFNLKMQEFINKKDPNKQVSSVLDEKIGISNFQLFENYNKIIKYDENNEGALEIMQDAGVSYIPIVHLEKQINVGAPIVKASDINLGSSLNNYRTEQDVAVVNINNVVVLLTLENMGAGEYRIKEVIPIKTVLGYYEELNETEFEEMLLVEGESMNFNQFKNNVLNQVNIYENVKDCDGNSMMESSREVKFWESGQYEGTIAYIPIDANRGWYAATRGYSGFEGELVAVKDISGDINTYILANVGPNGKPDFDFATVPGPDDCSTVVSLIQGQEVRGGSIGLSDAEAQALNRKAMSCMAEATREYEAGARLIKTQCGNFNLGKPPAVRPTAQCEDFMSPGDCKIMYNLCDPVMCPSSRCDLGGNYPVDNVFSTGIIGSLMLCWPNFENGKGVVVPICLTGLHAGIDNLEVTLKLYRDCLQENLNSGKMTGICDQIYSLYLCEFLWQNLDPLIKVGIPSLTESLTNRGGGEYALFGESWKNAMDSVDYFTQYYGINTFQAFKERSTAQVGTEVCKRFVSVAYPTQAKFWEEISKPESPTQFFATLQEMEGIGPSQSHYKIYYQIYAGQDQGVAYRIYLRSPGTPGYYMSPDRYYVPGGFGYLAAGEYLGESPDFTAPSGYREICVEINGQDNCGFGQVTTNFAIDELKNLYLESQIKQDVKTTKDCISGTPSLIPALSLNLQSMVQSMEEPAIYRRGVIRICASHDPGGGTEPNRYKLIGYCDNPAVGCYLDMNSVNESISDLGIREELATYAEEQEINMLLDRNKGQGLKPPKETREELTRKEKQINDKNGIREKVEDMEQQIFAQVQAEQSVSVEGKSTLVNEMKALIKEFEDISREALYDSEKARAEYNIAELREFIARIEGAKDIAEARKKATMCESLGGHWKSECGSEEEEIIDTSDQSKNIGKKCCKSTGAPITGPGVPGPGVTVTEDKLDTWPFELEAQPGAQSVPLYNIGTCYIESSYKNIIIGAGAEPGTMVRIKAVEEGKIIDIKSSDNILKKGYEELIFTIKHHETLYSRYRVITASQMSGGDFGVNVGTKEGRMLGKEDDVSEGYEIAYSHNGGILEFSMYHENPVENPNAQAKNPFCYFSSEILSRVSKCSEDIAKCVSFITWPLDISKYNQLSSCYGYRTLEGKDFTDGIDIYAPEGTPVYAVASGAVLRHEERCTLENDGCNGGFGNGIVIKHSNTLYTAYHHLSKTDVAVGEQVSAGQKIGEVGCTGRCTGNHLDFKVYTKENEVWRSETGKHPLCFFSESIRSKIVPTSGALTDARKYPENKNLFGTDDGGCNPNSAYCTTLTGTTSTQPAVTGTVCEEISSETECLATQGCWYDHAELPGYGGEEIPKNEVGTSGLIDKYEEYPRCRSCPPNKKCEGDFNGFFDSRADITFKTQEDCEQGASLQCDLDLCVWGEPDWWTGRRCKKAELPVDKLENMVSNFRKVLIEPFGSQNIGHYLNNPSMLTSSQYSDFKTKLLELKELVEQMRTFYEENNIHSPDHIEDIENWENQIDYALQEIESYEIFIVSSVDANVNYDSNNKMVESGDSSRVCVILKQDENYYNDHIAGKTVEEETVQQFEKTATINWYKIEPYSDHKAGGFPAYNFDTITSPVTLEQHIGYYRYQNVKQTAFWSQGQDTIEYQQSSAGTGWCINVDASYGVYRYRVEVQIDNKVYYTPGRRASVTGTGISNYASIYSGKLNYLLEPNAYKFWNGATGAGISEEVHRIVRKSNYAAEHDDYKNMYGTTDKELKFIEYIESHKGTVWVLGANAWQIENFVGMDCADVVVDSVNKMVGDNILTPSAAIPLGQSTASYLEDSFAYSEAYILEKSGETYTIKNALTGVDATLLVTGAGIRVGDLFLLKQGPTYQTPAFHTIIFYEDQGQPGVLDENDIFVYMTHAGVSKLEYFKHIDEKLNRNDVYFRIGRIPELAQP